MAYLTYDEYIAMGGSAESEATFPLYELKARKRIDYLTAERVKRMAVVPDAVKLCAVSLINMEAVVGTEAQVVNPVATSFNTDGYSESYGNVLNTEQANAQMNKTVISMLYGEYDDEGVHLLYRGVSGCDCVRR